MSNNSTTLLNQILQDYPESDSEQENGEEKSTSDDQDKEEEEREKSTLQEEIGETEKKDMEDNNAGVNSFDSGVVEATTPESRSNLSTTQSPSSLTDAAEEIAVEEETDESIIATQQREKCITPDNPGIVETVESSTAKGGAADVQEEVAAENKMSVNCGERKIHDEHIESSLEESSLMDEMALEEEIAPGPIHSHSGDEMSISDVSLSRMNVPPLSQSTPTHKSIFNFEIDDVEDNTSMSSTPDNDMHDLSMRLCLTTANSKKFMREERRRGKKITASKEDIAAAAEEEKKQEQSKIERLCAGASFMREVQVTDYVRKMIVNNATSTVSTQEKNNHELYNKAVEEAYEELAAKQKEPSSAASGEKKINALRKAAVEIVNRTRKCLESVTETPQYVHVNDITWDEEMVIDHKTVRSIQMDILSRQMPIFFRIVHGFKVDYSNNDDKRIKIQSNAELVLAYRALAELVHKRDPDKYIPLEEDVDEQHPAVSSQQEDMNMSFEIEEEERRSFSQRNSEQFTKTSNPFARMFVLVLNKNGLAIDDSVLSNYKTLRSQPVAEETAIEKINKVRNAVMSLKVDRKVIPDTIIKEKLNESRLWHNPLTIRASKLDDETHNILERALKGTSITGSQAFTREFLNARRVSPHSADQVLKDLASGSLQMPLARKVLHEHCTRVSYIFKGLLFETKVAELLEDRLEKSPNSIKIIKKHTTAKKKLCFEAVVKMRRDPEEILQALERDLNKCIAFEKARIFKASTNDCESGQLKCILNFISFHDLKTNKHIFTNAVKMSHPSIFFVTGAGDCVTAVPEMLGGEHPGIGYKLVNVDCVTVNIGSETNKDIRDSVSCVIIGGRKGRAWSHASLNEYLTERSVYTRISNWELRMLMYKVKKPYEPVAPSNWFNTVFVHSNDLLITAILGNMALNRLVTSLVDTETFKTILRQLQKTEESTNERDVKYVFDKQQQMKPPPQKRKNDGAPAVVVDSD